MDMEIERALYILENAVEQLKDAQAAGYERVTAYKNTYSLSGYVAQFGNDGFLDLVDIQASEDEE